MVASYYVMNRLRFRFYHGWAPSLPAGPATCPRHENGWEHMHSAAPASPPALCLHNTVCKGKKMKNYIRHASGHSHQRNQTILPVCLQVVLPVSDHVRGSGQDGVAENLPSSLRLLRRNLHTKNLKVLLWAVHELLLGVKILIWRGKKK